jgi:5'-nucleotidase
MRFLLTNDDGYDAPGLATLVRVAREFGEVFVVAPDSPQSYMGHRVTTDRALRALPTGPDAWHVDGTPADCTRIALRALQLPVDWVLSGINHGGNLGADIFTSGTCAAAREAALLGRPAIAFSQYINRSLMLDWDVSATLVREALQRRLSEQSTPRSFWNVNLFHGQPDAPYREVHCAPDNEPLDVRFSAQEDGWRFAGHYASRPRTPGRDIDHCFAGQVTVSLLTL